MTEDSRMVSVSNWEEAEIQPTVKPTGKSAASWMLVGHTRLLGSETWYHSQEWQSPGVSILHGPQAPNPTGDGGGPDDA